MGDTLFKRHETPAGKTLSNKIENISVEAPAPSGTVLSQSRGAGGRRQPCVLLTVAANPALSSPETPPLFKNKKIMLCRSTWPRLG